MSGCFVSFGAGVQSTALAFLVANRDERLRQAEAERSRFLFEAQDFRWPDTFIFADTGDEPASLYPHVGKMRAVLENAGIALQIVCKGNLGDHLMRKALEGWKGNNTLPFFLPREDSSGFSPSRRGCTREFKVRPIERWAKSHYGAVRGFLEPKVQCWLGISYDEMQRMKADDGRWRKWRHPLIWMRWGRAHCIEYLQTQTYADGSPVDIQRSACVYCPFRSNNEWREVAEVPDDWARALEIDDAVMVGHAKHGRIGGIKSLPYLNRYGLRLRDLRDFLNSEAAEDKRQLSLWDNECAGVCGV